MKFRGAICLGALALAGCQSASNEPPVSRTVQVAGTTEQFTAKLLQRRISRGYIIKQQTANMIVMDKPASDDFAAQFVFGSRFNTVPNYRLTYQMYGAKPITVNVSGAIITNPGSGFARLT